MASPRQNVLQRALKAYGTGDGATAERLCTKLLGTAPDDSGALHLLGVIRAQQRKFAEADRLIARSLEANVTTGALNNHAGVLIELDRPGEAIVRLNRALLMKPDYAEAHFNLGNGLRKLSRLDQAAKSFMRAIEIKPDYVEALQNLSDTLRELGRTEEAMAAMRRAIAIGRPGASLYNNLGILLRDVGSFEGARQCFDQAIALEPDMVGAHYNRARTGKVAPGDGVLSGLEGLARQAGAFSANDRAMLGFALAKAYEDVERYDDAFANLLDANRWARSLVDYDEAATTREADRIKAVFSPVLIADKAGCGSPSRIPIFVLGFPRSGTTLTEQILASHPDVHGAGELNFISQLASAPVADAESGFPEFVPRLDGLALQHLGDSYVERLKQFNAAARHVTDKNPGNFMFIGFIHLILPSARIIHVQRDPVDTCLSCFSQRFAGNASSFIYDLGELGRHYRRYRAMMDHWRRVLPPGVVLDVKYEDIIENLEAEARRIVDYCGLAWDERCLAFHETERAVRTASVTQVRQPIYRSSLQRWRRYEKHLGPLLEILEVPPGP